MSTETMRSMRQKKRMVLPRYEASVDRPFKSPSVYILCMVQLPFRLPFCIQWISVFIYKKKNKRKKKVAGYLVRVGL